IDPLLGPLANNGGLTFTHALLPGSPALDAGNNAIVTVATDQRGAARIADSGDPDATATVDIGAFEFVNHAPVAVEDAASCLEDQDVVVAVLANDGDADGDPLAAILVTAPAHGALTPHADGSFTYTPDPNFNGIDQFTYMANDGMTDSNIVTVTLSVTPV